MKRKRFSKFKVINLPELFAPCMVSSVAVACIVRATQCSEAKYYVLVHHMICS